MGAALTVLLLASQLGSAEPTGAQPAQFRVIWLEDPAHRAVVAWSTADEGSSTLHFDTQPRGGDAAAYAEQVSCDSGDYSLLSSLQYHHCRLTGLSPSTTYYFTAVTDGNASPELHFVTAPDDGRPFKLLFGGDSRSDQTQRRVMNELMRGLVEQYDDILALAHGGDYIANGLSMSEWSEWMTDHELTITGAGRVVPVIPARGNHEQYGEQYGRVWADPGSGRDDYFSTRIQQFLLITLNSEASLAGEQRDFLEEELRAANDEGMCFITAQYHRPAYPAVKEPGEALMHWVPLFEQYDADLIFESDGHALKRTVPIRNDAEDPTGVVYVGEGGLGVDQRSPEDFWYLDHAQSQHHVQILSVRATTMTYEVVRPDGTIGDTVRFDSRRCEPASLELTAPAAGDEWTSGAEQRIAWASTGVDLVDIDFSPDDGATWTSVASGIASTGAHDWRVTGEPTTTARIRIEAATVEATSGAFAIVPPPEPKEPPTEDDPPPPLPPDDEEETTPPPERTDPTPEAPGAAAPEQKTLADAGCTCRSIRTPTQEEPGHERAILVLVLVGFLYGRRRSSS